MAGKPGYTQLKWGADDFLPVPFGQCSKQYRAPWHNPKKGSQVTWRGSRKGFMLDMVTSRCQGVEIPQHAVKNNIIFTVGPPTVGCHGFEGPKHPVTVGNHLMMS